MSEKCKLALNIEINGQKFKVVEPKDPCQTIQKVLAKQQGRQVITPEQYKKLKNATSTH